MKRDLQRVNGQVVSAADTLAKQVQDILDALEVPPIDVEVRLTLQRRLYRRDRYFGGGGTGHITLLVRTIWES